MFRLLVGLEEQELAICSYILVTCGKFGPIISVHKNPAHLVGCVEESFGIYFTWQTNGSR